MLSRTETRDFVVRRIFLETETAEIKLMQKDAPEFINHYFDFKQWLDMALLEVIKGKRIAYGVYKSMLNSNSRPHLRLVGSVILKEEVYGRTIELKGLFIAKEFRRQGCGTELCNVAETVFSRRGYIAIRTFVPTPETNTIDFLLKRGYEILVTKESTYKKGERICEMLKTLPPLYGGDFFDLRRLFSWLLEHVYGFSNVNADGSESGITFSLKPKLQLNADASNTKSSINGILLISGNDAFIDKDKVTKILQENNGFNLVFIYGTSFTKDAQKKCRKNGIVFFDADSMRESLEKFFAYTLPDFKKADIAGVVVSIHPEYFKRIKSHQSFTYFKGGSVGEYLNKNNKVLFFSVPSSECPEGGIKAYGNVVDVYINSPDNIWRKYKKKNPLFTKIEYNAFVGNKHEILAITIDNLKWISPINLGKLKTIIGYEAQLEDITSLYINQKALNSFYDLRNEIERSEFASNSKEVHLQDLLEGQLSLMYTRLAEDKSLHDLLIQIQNVHPNFTSHDHDHSNNIIQNLGDIIPRKDWDKFSKLEIFLLLSSAWIHDVGMADLKGEIDYSNEAERKKKSIDFRKNHHERSSQYILEVSNYQRLGLTPPLAELISRICRAHDKRYDLRKLPKKWSVRGYEKYKEIRVQLLAALFRLADACDLSWQRVKEVLIAIYKIPQNYIESVPHMEGAKKISGVFPREKSLVVYSFASPQNTEQEKWVEFLKNNLEQDFLSVKSFLKDPENGIIFPYDDIRIEPLEAKIHHAIR